MSVSFNSSAPSELLAKFDAAIHQSAQAGKITTWEKTSTGYYTHKAADWRNKAFFYPIIEAGKLTFMIVKPNNGDVSAVIYGYYHGHLIETFLNHFDKNFSAAQASALPTMVDRIAA
jgi:hypothetical protein